MKKLLVLLLILVAIGAISTVAGLFLASDGSLLPGGDAYLVWEVDGPIVDYRPAGSWPFGAGGKRQSFASLYHSLTAARLDPGIVGIAVYVRNARFGLAVGEELRGLLLALRETGKFVECYLETAGEGSNGTLAYYLASACDSIALAPAGDVNLLGLYADGVFLRGALEKLKIDPYFSHVGDYKSAAETFTEYGHSPAAAEAISAVLDSYYATILDDLASARKIDGDRLSDIVDGAPYTAVEALGLGLVDALEYPDQFFDRITGRVGAAVRRRDIATYRPAPERLGGPRVAVVFAQGSIVRGVSGLDPWANRQQITAGDTVRLLDELADNDSIRAVVLRIDSPGGSAQASDLILRAVERLAEKKPVVASMANVAASGGYYIAAKASHIVASPTTLTGSIGVVGGKFVTRRLESELLGITHDTLKRGANAGLYSSVEPFSPVQQERYLHLMQGVYTTFLGHVAAGREMSVEEVTVVAGGRIWTGADAAQGGLVDRLGGLGVAIALAREAADLPPGQPLALDYYPRPTGLFQELLRARSELSSNRLLELAESFNARVEGGSRPLLEIPPELAQLASPF